MVAIKKAQEDIQLKHKIWKILWEKKMAGDNGECKLLQSTGLKASQSVYSFSKSIFVRLGSLLSTVQRSLNT